MSRFRKKPVEVEAEQWERQDQGYALADWCGGEYDPLTAGPGSPHSNGSDWGLLTVDTLEGDALTVAPGDWIICGVQGEFYPCKPDIFDATYEPALAARDLLYRDERAWARDILRRVRAVVVADPADTTR
jgi:hypothetical protein